MTVLDTKLIPVVTRLLAKFGKTAVFIVPGTTQYDANTGEGGVISPTEWSWKITPPSPWERRYGQNVTSVTAELSTLIAAENIPFTLSMKVRLRIELKIFDVVEIFPIYSGESVAAYELGLRSA